MLEFGNESNTRKEYIMNSKEENHSLYFYSPYDVQGILLWNVYTEPEKGAKNIIIQNVSENKVFSLAKEERNKMLQTHNFCELFDEKDKSMKYKSQQIIRNILDQIHLIASDVVLRKSKSQLNSEFLVGTPAKINSQDGHYKPISLKEKLHKKSFNIVYQKDLSHDPEQETPKLELQNKKFIIDEELFIPKKLVPIQKDEMDDNKSLPLKKNDSLHSSLISAKTDYQKRSPCPTDSNMDILKEFSLISKEDMLPEEPETNGVTIFLIKNWGNKNYMGLNGFEIFNTQGQLLGLTQDDLEISNSDNQQIFQMNENLVKKSFFTKNPSNQWKAYFQQQKYIKIKVNFNKNQSLGLLRFWNYNASRVEEDIGVKLMMVKDLREKRLFFYGFINKSDGNY